MALHSRYLQWTMCGLLAAMPVDAIAQLQPLRRFTAGDGLPSGNIFRLFQDSRGFIWVGTEDGVSRFDGDHFTSFVYHDEFEIGNSLPGAQGRNGDLWVSASGGLFRFRQETAAGQQAIERFTFGNEPSDWWLSPPFVDRRQMLWVAAGDRLFRADLTREPIEFIEEDLAAPLGHPYASLGKPRRILEDRHGSLWFAMERTRLIQRRPDGTVIEHLLRGDGLDVALVDAAIDRAGRLWCATTSGLFVLMPRALSQDGDEDAPPRPKSLMEQAMASTPPGDIRVAMRPPDTPGEVHRYDERHGIREAWHWARIIPTADGGAWLNNGMDVVHFNGETCHVYPSEQFGVEHLSPMLEDSAGNVWLGSTHRSYGLVRIARNGFTHFPLDEIRSEQVHDLHLDEQGDVALLTRTRADNDYVLAFFDGQRAHRIVLSTPAGPMAMRWKWHSSFLRDRQGEWWFASDAGLVRYPDVPFRKLGDVEPIRVYGVEDGLDGERLIHVFEDRRGDIWTSSRRSGFITRWDRATDRLHKYPLTGIPDPRSVGAVGGMVEDRHGQLWIGYSSGHLLRRRASHDDFEVLAPGRERGHWLIDMMMLDRSGRLWLATRTRGVAVVDDLEAAQPSFRWIGMREGLPSNHARSMVEARDGTIYVGTAAGLAAIDPNLGTIRRYGTGDGLGSDAIITMCYDPERDVIWVGAGGGLTRVDLRRLPVLTPPPIVLTGMTVGDERVELSALGVERMTDVEVQSDSPRLDVEFTSPCLTSGDDRRFQHRLVGTSEEWSTPSPQGRLTFPRLSPGFYQLEIRAVNVAGQHSATPATVGFRVLPPFWRQGWFVAACALLLTAAVYAVHRLRVSRLLEVQRVRSRIAADLHDDLGSSLSRISILSEVARCEVGASGNGQGGAHGSLDRLLDTIGTAARELVDSTSDVIWAVDPRCDDLGSAAARLRRFMAETLEERGVRCRVETPESKTTTALPTGVRRQVLLIAKEAVNNIGRHAGATMATVTLDVIDSVLHLEIRDDGCGFESADVPGGVQGGSRREDGGGRGLRNIVSRAEQLGGACRIESSRGAGTRIRVEVPVR